MISIKPYQTTSLPQSLTEKIGKLHQTFFGFQTQKAIQCLKERDLVYVFSEKKTQEVIGTIALKWIEQKESVIIYIGSAAFHDKYQRQNFLSYIIFKAFFRTLFKFPGKKMHFSCLMTTPKAYNICKRFPAHFPRPDRKTPQDIMSVMQQVSKIIMGKENTQNDKGVFIVKNFKNKNFVHDPSEKIVKSYNGFFEKVNPNYSHTALITVFTINFHSVCLGTWNALLYYEKKIKTNLRHIFMKN